MERLALTSAGRCRRVVCACRRLAGQEGQSLVMATLSIMAVFGMAALLLDGGSAYARRRLAQNAADAGSFAGARLLAKSATDSQIYAAIREYTVTRNGVDSFTATYSPAGEAVGRGTVPAGARGIAVRTGTTFDTFFAGLIGYPRLTVNTDAVASFGPVALPTNIQPLARYCPPSDTTLEQCGFQYGQTYDIWQGGGSGNFGWLSWNGIDNDAGYLASELGRNYVPDYIDPTHTCQKLAAGCWIAGLTGTTDKSQVRTALDEWQRVGLETGTPLTIVIYDQSTDTGQGVRYHIAGFAAFVLQDYRLASGNVTGKFVKWIVNGPVDDDAPNFGVTSVHMTR